MAGIPRRLHALLLESGASVHSCRGAPLWAAAYIGHVDTVKLLLGMGGADVHACGDAALYWAMFYEHADTVKLLMDRVHQL